jgi:hypothetical protein
MKPSFEEPEMSIAFIARRHFGSPGYRSPQTTMILRRRGGGQTVPPKDFNK